MMNTDRFDELATEAFYSALELSSKVEEARQELVTLYHRAQSDGDRYAMNELKQVLTELYKASDNPSMQAQELLKAKPQVREAVVA